MIAAILILTIGISGIFVLDGASFLVAILTLLTSPGQGGVIISIPQPPQTELGR